MRRLTPLLLLAACVRHLPPPPAPDPIVPQVESPRQPPAAGHTRVLIDTTGQPALVEEQSSTLEAWTGNGNAIDGATWVRLCKSTPCSVDLENGVHALRFTALHDDSWNGMGEVSVNGAPTAYRYALGYNVVRRWSQLLGVISIFIGIPLAVIGSGIALLDKNHPTAATGVAIGGGALIALGALFAALFPYELQDGTGAQWTL